MIDQKDGGTAHEVLTTDTTGHVTFKRVPRTDHYRIKVLNKPDGAVHTRINRGGDDEADSDLRSDGTTVSFYLSKFQGDVFGRIDIGYVLSPNTVFIPKAEMKPKVTVRVWNDKNNNGLQNSYEVGGIPGVKLELIDAITKEPIPGGFTATTNADGIAVFEGVEQLKWYRVKVLNPPGVATKKRVGTKEHLDSNMNSNNISDSFKLGKEQMNYDTLDFGYVLP